MSNSTSSNDNSGSGPPNSRNSGLGAATYYGAVAVVVFVLVALTVITRVLYTRKARRLARQRSIDSTGRDTEERVAMERRGEAVGLPTYRESVLPTSRNPILDSTPLPDSANRTSADTLPALTVMTALVPPTTLQPQISPPAYRVPPPKYEDAEEDADPANRIEGQAIDSEDHHPHDPDSTAVLSEMRMTNDSVVTLVVPDTIQALDQDQITTSVTDHQQSTDLGPDPHSLPPPPPPPPPPTDSESNQSNVVPPRP